jgi:RNA-directed DNA polymerase
MIKTSVNLQDLRRRIYVKAKTETTWRFWGMYVHVCKMETLREAYVLAKKNDGAPGSDGVSFAAIEAQGVEAFLEQIQDELTRRTYVPLPVRRQEIPKDGGKVRVLSIPAIRDRVVQGALKLYWSRSSRRTSNLDRLDTVPSGQLIKRLTGWPKRLFRKRHAS